MNTYPMNNRQQRGASSLLAVILLLVLGVMLLKASQRRLDNALRLGYDERHYLEAYQQAVSALSWGVHYPWIQTAISSSWSCQILPQETLTVCLKLSARTGFYLLKGSSTLTSYDSEGSNIVLYQWITPVAGKTEEWEATAHSWLDFCPEYDDKTCG